MNLDEKQSKANSHQLEKSAKEHYIDLLKKSLCGAVYDQPPMPIELFWAGRGWVKRGLIPVLNKLFGALGMKICFPVQHSRESIELGRIWPVQACSMIGLKRMDNLAACVESVLRENVPGDLIETGVWRGGACILMKGVLSVNGVCDRKVFVADSFRGLPEPNAAAYPADAGDRHHRFSSYLGVSRDKVEENFKRFDLLDSQVVFLEGWFKDTLPHLPSQQLAVLRLDGDMYESTMDALRHLYPKLSPGGFCIIDDYHLEGCRRAVDDYRKENGIAEPMQDIDGFGGLWKKGGTTA